MKRVQQRTKTLLLCALMALPALPVSAQDFAPVAAPIVPAPIIPALSVVEIEIDADLSSKLSRSGDMFPIRLASPIIVDGKTLVPAGAVGEGQVIQASKPGLAGKAGELSLAARYIMHGTTRIGLRSMIIGLPKARNNAGESVAGGAAAAGAGVFAPAAGPAGAVLSLIITGGNVRVAKGTMAQAKTSVAVTLPALEPSPIQSTTGEERQ